ncbi:MAG: lamin tail domain-containing protein [Candidatus Marinimicrobia bacterium]|nr:lamin tail domain-containing protein [Candidatus Neomarinimicrobiota bacterium]
MQYIIALAVLATISHAQIIPQSEKPDFSHKRGFYSEPFYLTITADPVNSTIRFTTDCSKPDRNVGTLYTEPILISKMTTIRAVAYEDTTLRSEVRTHSFVFPADVLTQDDSGVPEEEHSQDHVFWTEEFDMDDVTQSEQEMIEALLDIPMMYISAPWDSIFGIAGIHRGQNLEEYGGDLPHPDWIELVECSVEMIYPENYRNGRFKNWQENCGIKIQGGAGRWNNGSFDHKQSFTLEFKRKYGAAMLKNDYLISAPFNRESAPDKFDKIIIRTGFNRDWGSDWDRANCAYTRDQFGRDLQILMSGWGCHGTYAHLYINGKYWGQYNPCERMDNHALATYFGGESEDYFYGKGKGGIKFGSPDRYNYLNNTDWTNRQLSELAEYLAIDNYIDIALVHCYSNAGDSPQYYFGCRTNPPGPLYYTGWDLEDSFDGGARRSGPPVSMETYNMPYSGDKFKAYFKIKNNIDFKMKFADRVYKHCFNEGVLSDDRVIAIWDSSCRVIEKSILCEIARWGDERGVVYDYEHWKNECKDVRDDLTGRSDLLIAELRKSGMYPSIIIPPLHFKVGSEIITTPTYNCHEGSSLTIVFSMSAGGEIYYTYDGSDPRAWDLTGNTSASAVEVNDQIVTFPITHATTIKARIKDSGVWSPLQELKIIPKKTSPVVINEINYDSDADYDTEDWVEIYNNSESDISLAGWKLKDSNDENIFEFRQNTTLKQDSYLVICYDTTAFNALFADVDNYTGNINFKFGNEGDAVRIFDNNNTLVDLVVYDDVSPWPVQAAGGGATLELLNPEFDNTQVENWQASNDFGSPSRRNSTFTVTVINQDKESQNRLKNFTLMQNYPNPFNPTTNIKYNIATAGVVTLKIYNITGQEVETLVNEHQNSGLHSVKWTAQGIASGIYLYQLRTKDFSAIKKLVLIK